jgi:hypothetical protein
MQSKPIKLIVVAVVLSVALSATGLVLAQSSTYVDLGCWGLFSSGGTTQRVSSTVTVRDAFGQMTGGISQSSTVLIRGGHMQNWALLQPPPSPTITPEPPVGPESNFLPVIGAFVRTIRACQ